MNPCRPAIPLTRRRFLGRFLPALLACAGAPFLAAEGPAPRKGRSRISGTLWWIVPQEFQQMGLEGWRKELDEQQAIGFDLLWLCNVPALLEKQGFGLRHLLDLCAERNVEVILDMGTTGPWHAKLDVKTELAACGDNIRKIGKSFGGHPAFHAWYIPHEIYMCWDAMDRYIQELYPGLVQACKAAASLPVTLSPFFILDRTGVFGDFKFNEPEEYRDYWTALIRRSGLDIVMLQDSGEHFSYVTNDQRRPFFEAMSKACRRAGARFWANVEVAEMECASLEEYIRRYGRVHHSQARAIPWRPVPLSRLRDKLALAAEYAERMVSWGYREYCRPGTTPAARAWYDAYRAFVKTGT